MYMRRTEETPLYNPDLSRKVDEIVIAYEAEQHPAWRVYYQLRKRIIERKVPGWFPQEVRQ
jgi:hypothetical protein